MGIRLFSTDERPVRDVPPVFLALLVIALVAQVIWFVLQPEPAALARKLPPAPSARFLRLLSLNDPLVASRVTMLWLQAFDDQPGVSIPFMRLNYDRVISWLDVCLRLDPGSQYPLLAASRLYTFPPDKKKMRKMLNFVYKKFLEDPGTRWQWMAHAVYVAKHRLKDLDLALKFARAIRLNTRPGAVPDWIRDMEIYVLEDMGEIQADKILIGGLLDSGKIKDPNELRFLTGRLHALEKKQKNP